MGISPYFLTPALIKSNTYNIQNPLVFPVFLWPAVRPYIQLTLELNQGPILLEISIPMALWLELEGI